MSENHAKAAPAATEHPGKKRKLFWPIFLGVLASIFLMGAYAFYCFNTYPDRAKEGTGAEIILNLPRSQGPQTIAALLLESGALDKQNCFLWVSSETCFSWYLRLSQRMKDIKAGEHMLRDNMSPRELVDLLIRPPQAIQVSVTLPEGMNLREMAPRFEAAGVCSAQAFLQAARDPAFAQESGIPAKSFEGFLFPDTYRFKPNTEAKQVILAMKKRFDTVFEETKAKYPKEAAALLQDLNEQVKIISQRKKVEFQEGAAFDRYRLITFASLVEKETGSEAERGAIASVFLNRLLDPAFTPKYLATDPTIIYGLMESPQGFDGDIKTKDLRDASNLYNTYVNEGLPPGPITNFGKNALEAALNTPGTRCYYFVAKGDGTSFFSEKVELHERAVNIFIRSMNAGISGIEFSKRSPDCTSQPPGYTRSSGFVAAVIPPASAPTLVVPKNKGSSTVPVKGTTNPVVPKPIIGPVAPKPAGVAPLQPTPSPPSVKPAALSPAPVKPPR
jgi:UPF0755 protein